MTDPSAGAGPEVATEPHDEPIGGPTERSVRSLEVAGYPDHGDAPRFYGAATQDPAALYEHIRRRYGLVAPILLEADIPAWFVQGYREVHQVTTNAQLFPRDPSLWTCWDMVPEGWPVLGPVTPGEVVTYSDGQEHQRRAGAISDALDEIDRTELAFMCERVADRLIDAFAGAGAADLIGQYAQLVPQHMIARIFGLSEAEIPSLLDDINQSMNATEHTMSAQQRVMERLPQLVEDRKAQPGPDVPSRLLRHPAELTDTEIIVDLMTVMISAQSPTAAWIGNTLRLMLMDDEFSVTLQGGRSSVAQALNEVLWKDTPTQNIIGGWAARDCELGGRRIRRGDMLVLGLAAANGDPRVRPDDAPDDGVNRAHMSFGHGDHGCPFPAPELAEIMARAAVEVLLDRLPDVALAVAADGLSWLPSLWFRSLASLPVEFTPAERVHPAG